MLACMCMCVCLRVSLYKMGVLRRVVLAGSECCRSQYHIVSERMQCERRIYIRSQANITQMVVRSAIVMERETERARELIVFSQRGDRVQENVSLCLFVCALDLRVLV